MEHNKISRLMDAAIRKVALTNLELEHNAQCDACQDLLEIFIKELPGPPSPETSAKEFVRHPPAA